MATSMVKVEFLESICVAVNEANEETREKDNWSDLPALLVWMIKDRLDYPNNLRFSSVCKSWLHASIDYQPIVDAPPWLMMARNVWGSNREFISTSTGEKYNIDLPDLCTTRTLFSSKSWLLVLKLDYMYTNITDFDSPFFLLNPFTKAKIKLPYMAEGGHRGAFDVVNGNPHCVVLAITRSDCINLSITHPGDHTWATYAYKFGDLAELNFIDWVVTTGKLVYCVNFMTRVFIFDLANLEWTDLMGTADLVCTKFFSHYMESQGKLLQVHWPSRLNDASLVFYRLNDSNTKWEPLDHKDLEDTCWFFSWGGDRLSFVFKGKGMDKIYNSCRNLEAEDGRVNFQFRDASNSRGQLLLDLINVSTAEWPSVCWVDMG